MHKTKSVLRLTNWKCFIIKMLYNYVIRRTITYFISVRKKNTFY